MSDVVGNSQGLAPTANAVAPVGAPAPGAGPGPDLDHLPHGIRGLAEYPLVALPPWLVVLAVVLVLSLLSWLGWRWWKKRRPKQPVLNEVPPLYRLRDEIFAMEPSDPFLGKVQEDYFYSLSLVFRQFVEVRFGFPATDRTLKELRQPLRSHLPFAQDRVDAVLSFLERADMIKFAQAETSLGEARRYHGEVKAWVADLISTEQGLTQQEVNHQP